jgi:hypothetical protein
VRDELRDEAHTIEKSGAVWREMQTGGNGSVGIGAS